MYNPNIMKQIFLMTVGFSLSGKTTIINRILDKYKETFFVIDTRSIHDYLNMQYEIFRDDNSVEGNMYNTRQKTTDKIQFELLKLMIEGNFSVIKDSCNQVRLERKEQFGRVKGLNSKIKTVILFVNPKNEELMKTINRVDNELLEKGSKPVWKVLYEKVQKDRMEIPTPDESDYFIEYDRKNGANVLDELAKILR